MWLLVLIGAWLDVLIQYTTECAGLDLEIPFIVATIVTLWLVINEMISILENMIDIGIKLPPFLLPVAKYIRQQMEEKAQIGESTEGMKHDGA